jgi:predicted ATPase
LEYALSDSKQESKYLDFLISRLIELYEDHREQDDAIKKFVEVCNFYLFDKKFVYNESEIDLYLESFHGKERLDLDCLSSGEKQIVSLFSKIFLEVGKVFYIIFDEPELSLSMRWQMRLLPDIVSSGKCDFMIAATHSPFIFDNEMRKFAVALSDSMK